MRIIILSLLLTSGCYILEPFQWDVPNAPVSARALDPAHQEEWHTMLSNAVDNWNGFLQANYHCELPFRLVTSGGNEARLVPPDQWDNGPEAVGMEWRGHIEVEERRNADGVLGLPGNDSVILHELGHALGLQHVPLAERLSIMNPTGDSIIHPQDIHDAAIAIGCVAN
jgi:hypothetical protein